MKVEKRPQRIVQTERVAAPVVTTNVSVTGETQMAHTMFVDGSAKSAPYLKKFLQKAKDEDLPYVAWLWR